MKRWIVIPAALVIFAVGVAGEGVARRRVRPVKPTPVELLAPPVAGTYPSLWATSPQDTQVLGAWSFEDGMGGPDPQGWTTGDLTTAEPYFHVDDFTNLGGGANGGLVPLDGSRSLWCGLRAPPTGSETVYQSLPGYGDGWDQRFESVPFAVTGDVTVSFMVHYDSEPDYDVTYFDYLSKTGTWRTLASFDFRGDSLVTVVASADSLAGTAKLRFRFVSDSAWSDEDGWWDTDGAVVIDNIDVQDANGQVDFQDFELDAVGAMATWDGDWTATVPAPFGDFAALFDGTTVLQEDPGVTNNTWVWGFFNGSTDTYACGGHPEQPAVPGPVNVNGDVFGIYNEIRSPMIPVTVDTSGAPVDSVGQLLLEFDVYLDIPLGNPIAFGYSIRSLVDGSYGDWTFPRRFQGLAVVWSRLSESILPDIEPGASHIQVAINTINNCLTACPTACISHSPLIDNIRVVATGSDAFVVTNRNDSGTGSLRQAILDANATPNRSIITFLAIPEMLNPPATITLSSPLPTIEEPTIIDARVPPLYTGTPLVLVRGQNPAGGVLDVGTGADGSGIFGLHVQSLGSDAGIRTQASNCVVQACIAEFSNPGIAVSSGNVIIGGVGPGEANIIRSNTGAGIAVGMASFTTRGVTMRGNEITGSALGIDIDPGGQNTNDPFDYDLGPNRKQNHPVIYHIDSTETIHGYLDSAPSQTYTLDFYASSVCGSSRFGSGEVHLSTHIVTTDQIGRVAFELNFGTFPLPYVTATATDWQGSTSEFSPCYAPIVVTTGADSGPGSLRQAIIDGNTLQGGTIHFDAIKIVNLAAPLPTIDYPVVIDGFSVPGAFANENPVDQWSFHGLGAIILGGTGLTVAGGLSTIRGIAIGESSGNGITIVGPGGNTIEGCHVGLELVGTQARPNARDAIFIDNSDGNTIGGLVPSARMVIASSGRDGIHIEQSDSTRILGCFIGTDRSGQLDFGNGERGIHLHETTHSMIGGTHPEAGNVISGNEYEQIYVDNGGLGIVIAGNHIGVDPAGTTVVGTAPQGHAGITVKGDGVLVGGADPAARNVVAGGMWGIFVVLGQNHVVQGNYFGAGADGQILGVSRQGAMLRTTRDNLIGGTGPGEGNLFVGADSNGVVVSDFHGPARNNRIVGNSIHSNGTLGIDLGHDGITNNDIGDLDTGPNDLQNYPQVLSSAVSVAGSTYVDLAVFTSAEVFTADLYYSSACDPSGQGEGEVWIGSDVVDMTDNNGIGSMPVAVEGVVPGGAYLTATLTDDTGNTSEFSPCGEVSNAPAGTNVVSIPVDETTGTTPVTLTFDEITGGGNTSLSTSVPAPAPPEGGFLTSDSTYYEISTTATFTGSIEVCIAYDEALLVDDETNASIMHYDTTLTPEGWVDVTTSVDTDANIVCGSVTKLSPFALSVTSVSSVPDEVRSPMRFALHQNVPNPFNPVTTIGYDVGSGGANVTLVVYDVAGRRVRTLVNRRHAPGAYRTRWDGYNDQGARVATGVYFYRLTAGSFVDTKKMVLLK